MAMSAQDNDCFSFKSIYRHRSAGYRTPSPPRSLVEPNSPLSSSRFLTHTTTASTKRKRTPLDGESFRNGFDTTKSHFHVPAQDFRGKFQGPPSIDTKSLYHSQAGPSPLDALANAATSPQITQGFFTDAGPAPEESRLPSYDQSSAYVTPPNGSRHSKRTRSENVNWRPETFTHQRPATSYNSTANSLSASQGPNQVERYISDGHAGSNRTAPKSLEDQASNGASLLEAELLLNFSRTIKRSPPPFQAIPPTSLHQQSYIPSAQWANNQQENTVQGFDLLQESRFDGLMTANQFQATSGSLHNGFPQHRGTATIENVKLENAQSASNPAPAEPSIVLQNKRVDTNAAVHKPKQHRGWPKGKPRGPRTNAADPKKSNKVAKKSNTGASSTRKKRATGAIHKNHFETAQYEHWNEAKNAAESKFKRSRSAQPQLDHDEYDWPLPRQQRATSVEIRPTANSRSKKDASPGDIPEFRKGRKSKATSQAEKAATKTHDPCGSCGSVQNVTGGYLNLWINCNGCKVWFHATCVGFEKEREVKDIDKFFCKTCEPKHGATTFVRKSTRAHASVDYAGLHEGKMRTATDVVEHHYIEPIKDGRIQFQPESFPRMPPELITAEYFERCGGMTEPVLIPAALNPRSSLMVTEEEEQDEARAQNCPRLGIYSTDYEYDCEYDDGQDKLDMVIPQGLTVRRVAELYGPEEKVEVIDVKSQEGEDKRWNMRQWADYYEAEGEKPVRNVISLEVSQSALGKLIRRPKIVRDLDLQDSVWPAEDKEKGFFPRVQFYCLMSVADCYTDFHIDFGGSSVYYTILKGRKTFFFIPPTAKNLKKYEEWCLSPNQNSTFLGHETQECFRVDLYPGDTMLIPSGWIHAVWTPENSLVIGGNFLTRMHYGMQIQVNDIEKNTGVARKFRYPHFQKVLWLAALNYLKDDPLPSTVADILCSGKPFERQVAVHHDYKSGSAFESQPELFNAKYYSQGEIDGLPELLRYIYRTVMISLGKVHGLSKATQEAVVKSLPKGYGDHGALLKTFAMWISWKRGNEEIPHWAYPDFQLSDLEPTYGDKKLSAAEKKRMERQAAHEAHKHSADRRPSRHLDAEIQSAISQQQTVTEVNALLTKPETRLSPGKGVISDRGAQFGIKMIGQPPTESGPLPPSPVSSNAPINSVEMSEPNVDATIDVSKGNEVKNIEIENVESAETPVTQPPLAEPNSNDQNIAAPVTPGSKRSKARACIECRLSKRRCVHDEAGNVDPVKAQQQSIPRGSQTSKRSGLEDLISTPPKKIKTDTEDIQMLESSPLPATTDTIDSSIDLGPAGSPHEQVLSSTVQLPNATRTNHTQPNDDDVITVTESVSQQRSTISNGQVMMPSEMKTDNSEPATRQQVYISTEAREQSLQESTNLQVQGDTSPKKDDNNIATRESIEEAVLDKDLSNDRQVESSSRTSSLHIQSNSTDSNGAGHSAPSSPLTDLDASSPRQQVDEGTKVTTKERSLPPATKRTPRDRKQVDHFVNTHVNETPKTKAKSPTQTRSASQASSKKSNTKATNVKPNGIDINRSASRSESRELSRTKATSPIKAVVEEEDEDAKLARMLSVEQFSLRRRRGT